MGPGMDIQIPWISNLTQELYFLPSKTLLHSCKVTAQFQQLPICKKKTMRALIPSVDVRLQLAVYAIKSRLQFYTQLYIPRLFSVLQFLLPRLLSIQHGEKPCIYGIIKCIVSAVAMRDKLPYQAGDIFYGHVSQHVLLTADYYGPFRKTTLKFSWNIFESVGFIKFQLHSYV